MKRHFIGNIKLTSVKILEDRYNRFKEFNINRPMTLQKLVNRSLVLYLNDDEFRNTIDNMNQLTISGSSL
jgi:hypothetical protein